MTDYRSLPGLHSNPIDPRTGRWTDPWLKYLRDLAKQGSESSDQSAAIEQISDRVTALEQHESDASIQGLNSVAVSGTLADGLVQVALRGDSASPGALRYYGTDEDGTKGFHAMPEPDPQVFNRITADGDIRVTADGDLRITD